MWNLSTLDIFRSLQCSVQSLSMFQCSVVSVTYQITCRRDYFCIVYCVVELCEIWEIILKSGVFSPIVKV